MERSRPLALVSEETALGRWAIAHALETEGFVVRSASDLREASVMLANAEFRLVVVEVTSRKESVTGSIRCLKHFCPRTRIVLLVDADELREIRAVASAGCSERLWRAQLAAGRVTAARQFVRATATTQSGVPAGR